MQTMYLLHSNYLNKIILSLKKNISIELDKYKFLIKISALCIGVPVLLLVSLSRLSDLSFYYKQ